MECIFCSIPEENWIAENELAYAIYDLYPQSKGHALIIPKKHSDNYFELSDEEKSNLPVVIEEAKKLIENKFNPHGYNIGMNCGEAAGQTVFHFHCHIIPRYHGDMENPRGGVRHCVVGKGYY